MFPARDEPKGKRAPNRSLGVPLLVLAGFLVLLGSALYMSLSSRRLNRQAWRATYDERGLTVPQQGPREGYWGALISPKRPDEVLGWREPETHISGRLEIDSLGLQHASALTDPSFHIWILGGSVAFGGYASSIETTYFQRLVERFRARSIPVQITVQAAGAWTSENEVAALRQSLARVAPDVIVFLNGLNDLTVPDELPIADRVRLYLEDMAEALEITRANGARVVFALQPLFPQKKRLTRLEERILRRYGDAPRYVEAYGEFRRGLHELERRGATFVDCSGALDDETATTFTDIWHFTDPGHDMLARCLDEGLRGLLSGS